MLSRNFYKREVLILLILIYLTLLIIKNDTICKKNSENLTIYQFNLSKPNLFTEKFVYYCQANVKKLVKNSDKGFTIKIDKNVDSFEKLENDFKNFSLKLGGKWSPKKCKSFYKIAIIIPYRDRLANMKLFLKNMHPFLMRQNVQYGIYFIEPVEKLAFNRGTLMNVGFIESLRDSKNLWDCFFFHDVDMIALDERNLYECNREYPVHYAISLSKFNYKDLKNYLQKYYGGINAFTKDQFEKINGFSNSYYGWGGEDDDLRERTLKIFSKYLKQPKQIARYDTMSHKSQIMNKNRWKILSNMINTYKTSGINDGLNTTIYHTKEIRKTRLYTHILIDHPEG